MAKRDQMLRLMHIANVLQEKKKIGITYEDVRQYLEEKHYDQKGYDNDLAFSEKTFKRDRNLLLEIFGIEIQFKRSTMTYQIVVDENLKDSKGIFDNILLINAYKKKRIIPRLCFLKKDKHPDFII